MSIDRIEGDAAARDEFAHHIQAVNDAVMAARRYDPYRSAISLVVIAADLANANPETRVGIAWAMSRAALELDPDIRNARWQ
jgi:hypothetical protein